MSVNVTSLKEQLAYHKAKNIVSGFDAFDKKEIGQIFDKLLNENIYDDSFVNIAANENEISGEFEKCFSKALAFLEISHPADEQEATFYLLKQIMLKISNKEVDARYGLDQLLYSLNYTVWSDVEEGRLPGAFARIDEFAGFDVDWDIYDERYADSEMAEEKKAELDQKIITAAEAWLEKYKDRHNF